jgi:hypothetical protein
MNTMSERHTVEWRPTFIHPEPEHGDEWSASNINHFILGKMSPGRLHKAQDSFASNGKQKNPICHLSHVLVQHSSQTSYVFNKSTDSLCYLIIFYLLQNNVEWQ